MEKELIEQWAMLTPEQKDIFLQMLELLGKTERRNGT